MKYTGTPRNWPIYNVRLSEEQISILTKQVFPNVTTVISRELDKKKSFNNRIYFIDVDLKGFASEQSKAEVVLKVIGRFFGASKVQNEVACLLLLEQYCPDLPCPRVVAWSEGGTNACAIRNGVVEVLEHGTIHVDDERGAHGWLMTTKLPGRILQKEDLDPADSNLTAQLADIIGTWRTKIPHRKMIGNLTMETTGFALSKDHLPLQTMTPNLLFSESQPTSPLMTSPDYYSHLLADQLRKINTKPVFSYLRPRLFTRLETFNTNILPRLSFLNYKSTTADDQEAVFTHQDFAPRNILVTETVAPNSQTPTLTITGILDFEFAGFFPQLEESLNCLARQSDDWPPEFFAAFLSATAQRGIAVPGHGVDSALFDDMCDLVKMIEYVAPWWLEDGHITGSELERQLDETVEVVEGLLDRFERMVGK